MAATELTIRVNKKQLDALGPQLKKLGFEFQEVAKKGKKSGSELNAAFRQFKGTLAALGVAFGAREIIRGFFSSIKLISDLNEQTSKAKQVFGDASDAILKFSETSAESLGASRRQAIAMTAEIGNLLVAMGANEEEAADMSMKVVRLSADLASFNNLAGGTEEALNAIRSALVGESEPIRRLGSDVRQQRLEQLALAQGIDKTTASSNALVKAQLALEAIFKDTGKAQGDFARTSRGTENQLRILGANLENRITQIGEFFEPAINDAAFALNKMVGSQVQTGLTTMSTSMEIVRDRMAEAATQAEKMRMELEAATKETLKQALLQQIEDPFGFKAVETNAKNAEQAAQDAFAQGIASADSMSKAIEGNTKATIDFATVAPSATSVFINAYNQILQQLELMEGDQKNVTDEVKNTIESVKELKDAYNDTRSVSQILFERFALGKEDMDAIDTKATHFKDVIKEASGNVKEIEVASPQIDDSIDNAARSAEIFAAATGSAAASLLRGVGSAKELIFALIRAAAAAAAIQIGGAPGAFIGSFFGGFFQHGGNIPAGKFGLVGEAGPEIVSRPTFVPGPAHVAPINNDNRRFNSNVQMPIQIFTQSNFDVNSIFDIKTKLMPMIRRAIREGEPFL